jgi:putative ABC transport system permease protein
MRQQDFVKLIGQSIVAHKLRSVLTALGIGIGVTAVVLLTSIGEGLNTYMVEMFTQFGTTTVQIQPGKTSTFGFTPGVLNSTRPLSLADATALERAPHVVAAVPMVAGSATVEGNNRERSVTVYAVGPEFDRAFKVDVVSGSFLPHDELERARNVAVLGAKLYTELFGGGNALGARIRVGGQRYRVVGIMESKGDMVGIDLDDTVYIRAARGLELFNRQGLLEIDVL